MNILKRIKWSLMTSESICKEFIGKTIVNQLDADNPFKDTTLVCYDVLDVNSGYVKFTTRYSDFPNSKPKVESEKCCWFVYKIYRRA